MQTVFSKNEGIQYLKNSIANELTGFKLKDEYIENQPNNSFTLKYVCDGIEILFVNDRGYIEVSVKYQSGIEYLHDIDSSVSNVLFNKAGLESIVKVLKKIF